MPDVKSVAVSVASPTGPDDPGRAVLGYYVVLGDVLTMTDGDGVPVRRRYGGELYKHTLQADEDAHVIASRLTLSIWRSNTGGEMRGGFNRKIIYNDSWMA
jgi:hypothetical protein